eukprot:CAMPEP_0175728146 /NCGR_PEP_ID=MMETSP0097-20121207/49150_1 /TAXON_ID=311494 /ORGANISM="Alexandrium monilatum, Strain CCMP3105" /LENGTH=832 /DNA_ID=CAMNT_0017035993 /DNA_START=66 /DNA_END=2562 /DNA_ORIENTATION=+
MTSARAFARRPLGRRSCYEREKMHACMHADNPSANSTRLDGVSGPGWLARAQHRNLEGPRRVRTALPTAAARGRARTYARALNTLPPACRMPEVACLAPANSGQTEKLINSWRPHSEGAGQRWRDRGADVGAVASDRGVRQWIDREATSLARQPVIAVVNQRGKIRTHAAPSALTELLAGAWGPGGRTDRPRVLRPVDALAGPLRHPALPKVVLVQEAVGHGERRGALHLDPQVRVALQVRPKQVHVQRDQGGGLFRQARNRQSARLGAQLRGEPLDEVPPRQGVADRPAAHHRPQDAPLGRGERLARAEGLPPRSAQAEDAAELPDGEAVGLEGLRVQQRLPLRQVGLPALRHLPERLRAADAEEHRKGGDVQLVHRDGAVVQRLLQHGADGSADTQQVGGAAGRVQERVDALPGAGERVARLLEDVARLLPDPLQLLRVVAEAVQALLLNLGVHGAPQRGDKLQRRVGPACPEVVHGNEVVLTGPAETEEHLDLPVAQKHVKPPHKGGKLSPGDMAVLVLVNLGARRLHGGSQVLQGDPGLVHVAQTALKLHHAVNKLLAAHETVARDAKIGVEPLAGLLARAQAEPAVDIRRKGAQVPLPDGALVSAVHCAEEVLVAGGRARLVPAVPEAPLRPRGRPLAWGGAEAVLGRRRPRRGAPVRLSQAPGAQGPLRAPVHLLHRTHVHGHRAREHAGHVRLEVLVVLEIAVEVLELPRDVEDGLRRHELLPRPQASAAQEGRLADGRSRRETEARGLRGHVGCQDAGGALDDELQARPVRVHDLAGLRGPPPAAGAAQQLLELRLREAVLVEEQRVEQRLVRAHLLQDKLVEL